MTLHRAMNVALDGFKVVVSFVYVYVVYRVCVCLVSLAPRRFLWLPRTSTVSWLARCLGSRALLG